MKLYRLLHACTSQYEFKWAKLYLVEAQELMKLIDSSGSSTGFALFYTEKALYHYYLSEFAQAYADSYKALLLLHDYFSTRTNRRDPPREPIAFMNMAADGAEMFRSVGAALGGGFGAGLGGGFGVGAGLGTQVSRTSRAPALPNDFAHSLYPYLPPKTILDILRHASKICVVRRQFKEAALLIEYAVKFARSFFFLFLTLHIIRSVPPRPPTILVFSNNDIFYYGQEMFPDNISFFL